MAPRKLTRGVSLPVWTSESKIPFSDPSSHPEVPHTNGTRRRIPNPVPFIRSLLVTALIYIRITCRTVALALAVVNFGIGIALISDLVGWFACRNAASSTSASGNAVCYAYNWVHFVLAWIKDFLGAVMDAIVADASSGRAVVSSIG